MWLASGLDEPCGLAAVSACQRRLFSPLVDVAVDRTSLCCPTGGQERTVGDAAVNDQRRCFVRQLHGGLPYAWTSGLPLGGFKMVQRSCLRDSCSLGSARGHRTVASLRQCSRKVAPRVPHGTSGVSRSRSLRIGKTIRPAPRTTLRPPAGTQTVQRTAGSEGRR